MDPVLAGLAALVVLGSAAALAMRNLLSAVIAVGIAGMGLAILFLLLGAPDIAITQVVVEVIVVTVMIRAVARTGDEEEGRPRSPAAILAGAGAALVIGGAALAAFAALPPLGAPRPTPSFWYLAESLPGAGAANAVTAIVLDFRGYDTLGEATVILAAVAGALVVARGSGGGAAGERDGAEAAEPAEAPAPAAPAAARGREEAIRAQG
ncbi:MAG: DUF4040 domain-containing protein [Planctomycetes bacterium]|nr:DUF4040 domain-containing protein [Planctomycetota bacterium]